MKQIVSLMIFLVIFILLSGCLGGKNETPKEYHGDANDYLLLENDLEIGSSWTTDGVDQSFDNPEKEGTESRAKIVLENEDEDELVVAVYIMEDIDSSKKIVDDYRMDYASYDIQEIDDVGDEAFGFTYWGTSVVFIRFSNVMVGVSWEGGTISQARDLGILQMDKIKE